MLYRRRVQTDRQQARIWLRDVLSEARAALSDEISYRFTDLQYALSVAVDDAVERRLRELDAHIADIDAAAAEDAAGRAKRRAAGPAGPRRGTREAEAGRRRPGTGEVPDTRPEGGVMSEYGWPDDHDDGHDFEQPDDGGLYHEDPLPGLDEQMPDEHLWDDVHHDDAGRTPDDRDDARRARRPVDHDAAVEHDAADHDVRRPRRRRRAAADDGHDLGTVGADPDALPEPGDEAVSLFPPVVDVGPLPEPVDGFPWIDTGSLGLVDPAAVHTPPEQTRTRRSSPSTPPPTCRRAPTRGPRWPSREDPATSALARWWSEGQ